MNTPPVIRAADMERLSPNERDQLVNDRVVTDLAQVPPEFLDRVQAKGRRLLEERKLLGPDPS